MRHACWSHRCASCALARASAPPREAATWTGPRWSRGRRATVARASVTFGCRARRSIGAAAAAELAPWWPPLATRPLSSKGLCRGSASSATLAHVGAERTSRVRMPGSALRPVEARWRSAAAPRRLQA
jgi:hypothetical protein